MARRSTAHEIRSKAEYRVALEWLVKFRHALDNPERVGKDLDEEAREAILKGYRRQMEDLHERVEAYEALHQRETGEIEIDLGWRLESPPQAAQLTRTEARLLRFLAARPGTLFRKDELVRALWPEERTDHLIEVHISNLRRKLRSAGCDRELIKTVPGRGYSFRRLEPARADTQTA